MARFEIIAIVLLTAAAFGLRLAYLLNSHPFIDEFTTVLAAQAILERGLPILPSGLFYEHGLLFSYIDAPFVWLAGEALQFPVARWPSLLLGTLTVPLIYRIGRRWLTPEAALLAAALLALSPEGMVWGGRARMYTLAQLLILVMVFLAYEGNVGIGRRLRWLAGLALLAVLVAQFGALIFVPPLLAGLFVVKWLSQPPAAQNSLSRFLPIPAPELVGLGVIIGVAVWIKRLGQPLGKPALSSTASANPLFELWDTVAYQIGLSLDIESAVTFLARQFGVPHHLWLLVAALLGLLLLLVSLRQRNRLGQNLPLLFLWLVFGLVVLEMITLLQPFRRNPRYLVMGLPLFYLLVGGTLSQIQQLRPHIRHPLLQRWQPVAALLLLLVFAVLQLNGLWQDLQIAYQTPEPAYEEAFQYVAARRGNDDVVLTMNPSAAALYLDQTDYFAMQDDADQFLLDLETAPKDRWLGDPWIGTAADFNQVLNAQPTTWFVIDTIRLPEYYRGDWQALLGSQMELVWAEDNALVYRTTENRMALPTSPSATVQATLGDRIELIGYSQQVQPPEGGQKGRYFPTLFWNALAEISIDYTVFVHIRDQSGTNIAQGDAQPLDGAYPTSQWQPAETVIDPHQIELPADLPPDTYQVWLGMYQLETLERLPVQGDRSGENAILLGDLVVQ